LNFLFGILERISKNEKYFFFNPKEKQDIGILSTGFLCPEITNHASQKNIFELSCAIYYLLKN